MKSFSMSANIHLAGNVAKYQEDEKGIGGWIDLSSNVYPHVSLFCDREALQSIMSAVKTALIELDIKEGRLVPGDDGVLDLGGDPFECAHQE